MTVTFPWCSGRRFLPRPNLLAFLTTGLCKLDANCVTIGIVLYAAVWQALINHAQLLNQVA